MRLNIFGYLTAISMLLMGCGGSTSNPTTASRDDLAPPSGLISITGDKQIKLRWQGFNAEDEFRGYQVFGAAVGLDELRTLVKYPRTPTDAGELMSMSIPRCADNTKFFEAFGFKETDAKCEAASDEEMTGNSYRLASAPSKDDEEEDDKNAPLRHALDCAEDTTEFVSLPVTKDNGRKLHYCTVTKLKDRKGEETALENGTTYTFIAVAVAGEKYNQISWSSNVIEDSPATLVFEGEITLAKDEYVYFAFEGLEAMEAPEPTACPTGSSNPICRLTTANNVSAKGIYIARDNSEASNSDRIFFSTAQNNLTSHGDVKFQFVGPASNGNYRGYLPGDQASVTGHIGDGTKFTVTGDQIFDITVRLDGKTHYGKVIVTDVTSEDPTNKGGKITLNVAIVVQPEADLPYYLR